MREQEFEVFARCWGGAWEICGKQVTPTAVRFAFEALRNFELPDVTRALSAHARDPDTGMYPPKPADVIKHLRGTKGSRAMIAWSKVLKGIKSVGAWESIAFDDPIIHACIRDMGGWVSLCEVQEDELPFRERAFSQRYESYAMHGCEESPRYLPGRAETYNASHGHHCSPPALIGNREQAIALLNGDTKLLVSA